MVLTFKIPWSKYLDHHDRFARILCPYFYDFLIYKYLVEYDWEALLIRMYVHH